MNRRDFLKRIVAAPVAAVAAVKAGELAAASRRRPCGDYFIRNTVQNRSDLQAAFDFLDEPRRRVEQAIRDFQDVSGHPPMPADPWLREKIHASVEEIIAHRQELLASGEMKPLFST